MDQKVSKFKDIFSGLERAHGVFQPNGKVKENGKREGDAWINKKPVEDIKRTPLHFGHTLIFND